MMTSAVQPQMISTQKQQSAHTFDCNLLDILKACLSAVKIQAVTSFASMKKSTQSRM
jgi:hypothetical protein